MAVPIIAALGAGALQALFNPEVISNISRGISSAFDPSARAYRQQLREDRRQLKANDFGMSEAQKNDALSSVMRQQQAAARGTEAALRQQASAMGPRSGAAMEAMRGMGADLAGQAAGARGQVEAASSQMAVQQKAQALDRLNQRRLEKASKAAQAGAAAAAGAGSFEKGYRDTRQYQKDYKQQMEETGLKPVGMTAPAMTSGYQSQLDAVARQKQMADLMYGALGGQGGGYR